MHFDDHIKAKLDKRRKDNAFRTLRVGDDNKIDFSSNDYLGISRKSLLGNDLLLVKGATGSRLISGTYPSIVALEDQLKDFYKGEDALLFNSGYDANLGVLSSIPSRHDVILFDEYVHASIKDGMKLSDAKSYRFKHNDLGDLKRLLYSYSKDSRVLVVVESIYSMDGDRTDLMALVDLKRDFDFDIMVDEAHSTGICGEKGEGLVVELGLENDVLIRVHTFGKALAYHGAVVISSTDIKDFLINFSRPFVYTTAMPENSVFYLKNIHDKMSKDLFNVFNIKFLSGLFNSLIEECGLSANLLGEGPIFAYLKAGNEHVKSLSSYLQDEGFDIRPILSPTVQKGKERIRIVLHDFNTEDEIRALVDAIKIWELK